jgi:hypothetical protein
MPASTKKSGAYEKGLREGHADKNKPSIEIEIKPEGEEEEEMGTEEMDGAKSHSRKRSAKGAKHTKAPMDGGMYGKKPMDGEGCNCGKRKAKCDGNCGKKMDRNDALTPQEYLAACELGIQNRTRSYIRARLDTAERLDKKCGASGIADNKTCHVGRGKGPVGRLKAANKTWEARYGKRPKTSNKDKIKALGITALAVGAGVGAAALVNKVRNKGNKPAVPFDLGNIRVPKPGAINKPGTASDLAKAADRGRLNELESLARGNNPALEAQMEVSKARNAEVRKALENTRAELKRLRTEIGVWGPNRIKPFKRRRKDSVYAAGFELDTATLEF